MCWFNPTLQDLAECRCPIHAVSCMIGHSREARTALAHHSPNTVISTGGGGFAAVNH